MAVKVSENTREMIACVAGATLSTPATQATVDVDVVESALRDVNLSSGRETVFKKPEQELAVRAPTEMFWRFCGPDTARV